MTLDDFAEKMDKRFDQVDDKLDMINMTVAKHTVSLTGHDREPMKTEGVQCRNCRYCDHNQSWCKVKAQSVRVLSVRDCRMYRKQPPAWN